MLANVILILLLIVAFLIGIGILIGRAIPRGRRCPKCGRDVLPTEKCSLCVASAQAKASPAEASAIAAKVARELHRDGKLDPASFRHMMDALGQPLQIEPAYASAASIREAERAIGRPGGQNAGPRTLGVAAAPLEVIPLEQPATPLPATPSAKPPPLPKPAAPLLPEVPKRPWSEVLARFLEESNIRWGELIGGLLMIGCSIALVATFWTAIAAQPWLKFFIFTGATAAVLGVGLYSEHRWKLPTTSRGTLLAGVLLIPLTFLAIVLQSGEPARGLAIVAEVGGIALFAWLAYLAGRVLVPRMPLLLSAGVLGTSAAQMVINRFAASSSAAPMLLALAALPLAFYCATTLWALVITGRDRVRAVESNQLLLLLGALTLSVLLPMGLLAHRGGDWLATLRMITPLLSFGAVPILGCGLVMWRRIDDPRLAGARTGWTAIAILGAAAMVGTIALAWPKPSMLISTALLDFAALTAVAFVCDIAAAHALALPCLLVAYVIGFHLVQPTAHANHIDWGVTSRNLIAAIGSQTTATALAGLVGAIAIGAEALRRSGRKLHSLAYVLGAAAVAAISVAMICVYGVARSPDGGATWVLAIYAVGALLAAWRTMHAAAGWAGATISAAALIQGLVFRYPIASAVIDRWTLALLIHASLMAALAIAASISGRIRRAIEEPVIAAALLISAAAGVAVFLELTNTVPVPFGKLAAYTLWGAAIWLVVTLITDHAVVFTIFQGVLCAASVLGATALMQQRAWFATLDQPLLDPRTIQAQGIALALLSFAWVILRLALRRMGIAGRLGIVGQPSGGIDRFVPFILLGLGAVILVGAAAPAVNAEMCPVSQIGASVPSHPLIYGTGSWLLWVCLMGVFIVGLWERFDRAAVYALAIALCAGGLLLAGRFEAQLAIGSAYRWIGVAVLAVLSTALWMRNQTVPVLARLGWPEFEARSAGLGVALRRVLMALIAAPILILTLSRAATALAGVAVAGPYSESFFARIGPSANYFVPLVVVTLVLLGFAIRERSNGFAFAAALVLYLGVSISYALWTNASGPMQLSNWVMLAQINALIGALYAIAWIAIRAMRMIQDDEHRAISPLLVAQSAIALIAAFLPVLPAEMVIALSPDRIVPVARQISDVWGWLGCALAGFAAIWLFWQWRRQIAAGAICSILVVGGSLAAISAAGASDSWAAHHILIAGRVIAAFAMLALGLAGTIGRPEQSEHRSPGPLAQRLGWPRLHPDVTRWVVTLWAIVVLLSSVESWEDQSLHWWMAGLVSASILAVGLSLWTLRNEWLFPAGFLLNVIATRLHVLKWTVFGAGQRNLFECIQLNIVILALSGVAALTIELRVLRPMRERIADESRRTFHRFAALLATIAVAFVAAESLAGQVFFGGALHTSSALTFGSLAASAFLVFACLGDTQTKGVFASLYLIGLATVIMLLGSFGSRWAPRDICAVIALAAYAILVGYIFAIRRTLLAGFEQMKIPSRASCPGFAPRWLDVLTLPQAAIVAAVSFHIVLSSHQVATRLAASIATIGMAVGIGLLALEEGRARMKQCALILAAFGAVLWGWAWLTPDQIENGPHRLVIVMVALGFITALYAVGFVKLLPSAPEWSSAAQTLVPILAPATALALFATLGMEIHLFDGRGVPMHWLAITAVALALVGLTVAAILCAVIPGRDPLDLSERARTAYVYLAEFLLLVLCVHLRLCVPALFRLHIWQHFWPIIVIVLAFGGVGLGHFFRQQRRNVLAEPLENTAAFLPILPTITFWIASTTWHNTHVDYALLLVLAGLVYGTLGILRQSFWFGICSALAGNGALWYVLHQADGLGFFQHPQLWLIPVALSVLAAGYLNRKHLSDSQMKAIRYITMLVVYVSSTADILLNGIGSAPWLPLVLALLAIGGVIAGIALRVQSFLFLGATFLLVSIAAMIQYATIQVRSTWPWLVAGICIGTAIVVVFALFEKKRAQMVALVEGIKEWHG